MLTPRPTHGLTLGKFAPLHKGHQLVIETALAECDALTVVIYDSPEVTSVPLTVRANWIRRLYPQVRVVEAWDGPKEVGDTPEIKRINEDYIIERLGIRGVTHFYSSEFYGDHMSRALGAVDRRVDEARGRVPISGTRIREQPYACRAFLDPLVYRDLVTSVVFLGAPSTGKTTLAERMAAELGTVWMPEYGREYWQLHHIDRRLTPGQLVEIAEGHLEREERLLFDANQYLFVDTNAITTFMFALDYHGRAEERLRQLAEVAATRYDLVFLCDADIPYDDTWDRSGDVQRQTFQKRIVADLLARKIPFVTLRGALAQRVATVKHVLARHTKYRSLADTLLATTEEQP
jgi:HTH-type transcriptional regulator, transcriptional repressor of NAD biosynthesis genes